MNGDRMQESKTGAPAANMPPQSPKSDLAAPPRSGDTPASLVKDPKRLLAPARLLVALCLVFAIVGIGSDALQLLLFHKMETGAFANNPEMIAAAESNDQRQLFVYVPYMIVLILSFVFVGRWIYFSNKNLRAFGAVGLSFRPGWAVGWYFIPIANLWKPYQAMKEIWQASSDPLDWSRQQTPGLMPVWWALWLIAGVVDRISFRLSNNAETIADFQIATSINIASAGLNIALYTVFLMLMSRISRLQIDTLENKNTLAVFGP